METYKNCFIACNSDVVRCGNCDCVNRTKIIIMDEQSQDVDCEYCGRKKSDEMCKIHPNKCK